MEIFIVAVLTGLGLLLGMCLIWKGYHPYQDSTTQPGRSGSRGIHVRKHES